VARRDHAVEQFARQWLAAVDMAAQSLQHIPLPAEVLHELAWQLDRVAFHTRDAGNRQLLDLRQHVVQAVAELVEQRDDVVVAQQRRLAVQRWREVAHQVRHRKLQRAVGSAPAGAAFVHPGAGTLARSRVEVEVERGHGFAAAPDAVVAHAVVPDRRDFFADGDAEQRLDELEQAAQHMRLGEVLPDLLAAEGIARLLELLAGVGAVPDLQVGQAELARGEFAQLGQFALGKRPCAARQVAHEAQHLVGRARHLGHQCQVGVGGMCEQGALLLPQFEQFAHQRRVVSFGRAVFAGAGAVGAEHRLAQRAVARELHHRHVAGRLQRQPPACLAGGRGSGLAHVLGHAREFGCRDLQREGIGGIEHVVAELLGERPGAVLDGGVSLTGRTLQFGAAKDEVAQRVGQRLALRRLQPRRVGVRGHRLVLGIEAGVGAQTGIEVDDAGLVLGMRGAQRRRIGDGLQVTDLRPGGTQPLHGGVEHGGQRVVVGSHLRTDRAFERCIGVRQQDVERRADMLGTQRREVRALGSVQQRVHARASAACRVLKSSIVIVIGPTPPGTGVI